MSEVDREMNLLYLTAREEGVAVDFDVQSVSEAATGIVNEEKVAHVIAESKAEVARFNAETVAQWVNVQTGILDQLKRADFDGIFKQALETFK